MGRQDEWGQAREILAEAGYQLIKQKGHYGIFRNGKRVYTLPSSPSDWRTFRNVVSEIRRKLGVDLRPRPKRSSK